MTSAAALARLEIAGISAGYRHRPVLRDVTLSPFEAGHVVALVGPNGAGKTTLLRVLAGLLRPTAGSIRLGDRDLLHAKHRVIDVSFMPQTLPQRVALTVLEAVMSAIKASALPEGAHAGLTTEERAIAMLERIGIADLALSPLDRLSGGQRQLASLAQAVVREPRLLLLDEPTSALDLRHQVVVMDLVQQLAAEGRIVVVVLHDLSLAVRWAERIVVLHDGRVHAEGLAATAITPAVLSEVYGVDARVETCSRGRLHVMVDGAQTREARV